MPYIRKTSDIFISDELKNVLEVIESQSLVAHLLLKKRHLKEDLVDDHVNFISISSNDKNKISYLNQDRITALEESGVDSSEFWKTSKRFHVKPGAFVGKIFKNITAKEVETFSNLFRAESNKEQFKLTVVNGDDIKRYYHWESYLNDRGTLGVSCMKHDSCQKYLNVYSDNTDNVSMLVMTDDKGYLMGRAILWQFETYKLMDRIYTVNDEKLQLHFKKWATDNGYLYKSEQNWYNTLFFENMNTPKKELYLKLDLPSKNFRYYPYVDTFKFLDNDGILYNYIPEDTSIRTLCATDGSKYDSDYLRFDKIDKVFRYRGECVYLTYIETYTAERNTVWSEVNDQYILRSDSFYDEEINDHIFKKELDDKNNQEKIKSRKEWMAEREKEKSKRKMNISSLSGSLTGEMIEQLSSQFMDIIVSSSGVPSHYFTYRGGDEPTFELMENEPQQEVDCSEPSSEQ